MNNTKNASGINDFLDSYVDVNMSEENSSFLNSLDSITPEELSGRKASTKKKSSLSNLFIDLCGLLCLAVFVFCLYRVVIISAGYNQSDKMYEAIAEDYINALSGKNIGLVNSLSRDKGLTPLKPNSSNGQGEEENREEDDDPSYDVVTGSFLYQQILVFLENLRSQNDDTFGYIHIDGTKISFPVVRSEENGYYLTHSFEKTYLKSGTIYVDSRNSRSIEQNRNTIFYGHNLTNGGMFHHVVDFLNEDVFMNSDITVSTFDGVYTFKVFSIYPTISTGDYFRVYFRDSEDFIDFCKQEESRSLFHKEGIEFNEDSIIITLSTCIHAQKEGRYALHAILTGVEK